ncbi:hypothetical protein FLL45_00070 [Aliikangiella marina]|uniref:Immunity MXAN-0049 protein domain-containing protein n=1 Tax=Aliikangiella marina TaxID=1712262 RepID=A0A545TGP0_9GAMM|nr:DUF1629 domain-containing protein [Aliikangiella marina]TQV76399.1 hypothetical protein FLL45_00070 [Aliikangiella marina]
MKYYIMRQYTLIEGSPAIDGVPDNVDSLEWIQGKAMTNPSDEGPLILDLALESGDYRGDIIDGFLTLYSDELKDALEKFGIDNVKFYPVRLRDQDTNETEGGYWLANILGLLDCVDLNKSKVKPWTTGIGYDFLSMVIDESKTNGLKIFRLKDDPTKVIISEEVKAHLESSDCLYGVELTLTEDYSDW